MRKGDPNHLVGNTQSLLTLNPYYIGGYVPPASLADLMSPKTSNENNNNTYHSKRQSVKLPKGSQLITSASCSNSVHAKTIDHDDNISRRKT